MQRPVFCLNTDALKFKLDIEPEKHFHHSLRQNMNQLITYNQIVNYSFITNQPSQTQYYQKCNIEKI